MKPTPKSLQKTAGVALASLAVFVSGASAKTPLYLQANAPVASRVQDLLSRMTVEEKARQLDMYSGRDSHIAPDGTFKPETGAALWGDIGVGSIHDLYPANSAMPNAIQAWLKANTRLGIPALFIEEGLHGFLDSGHTVFPHSISTAATFNPDNARAVAATVAAEMRADNVHMSLSPVLCLARDPRWGRSQETFGEDPYLSGRMAVAYVQGMQGGSLDTDHTVIAEPKHFVAHGSPEGGRNTAEVHVGERELEEIFYPAFEAAFVEGGALGVMCAYHEIDGVPMAANHHILMDVLRGQWGFQGFVLSDLGAINELETRHHVAADAESAIAQAITAGVDMQFYDYPHDVFVKSIVKATSDGSLAKKDLDRAVGDVLRVKFMLGLFDHPYVDPGMTAKVWRSPSSLNASLIDARQSMTLLRNEGGLLPLRKNLKSIAVIGPGADHLCTGDYSGGGNGHSVTILEGIKAAVPASTQVVYVKGCEFDPPQGSEDAGIQDAVNAARRADVVIVALGESDASDSEGNDRDDLNLTGRQEDLLEAVQATGTPTVLVLQNGRALSINWASQHVPAILDAWFSGEFGGKAIAETLFGDNNPAGRCPVSFPKSVGQIPVTYDRHPSATGGYYNGDSRPLYRFGYGLSYTKFDYSNLVITPTSGSADQTFTVSADIKNTGSRAGDEVAQLYIRDVVSSVATPERALKGFQRIHLEPGEQKTVTFQLARKDLQLLDRDMKWTVEPGDFDIMLGGDSEGGLKGRLTVRKR